MKPPFALIHGYWAKKVQIGRKSVIVLRRRNTITGNFKTLKVKETTNLIPHFDEYGEYELEATDTAVLVFFTKFHKQYTLTDIFNALIEADWFDITDEECDDDYEIEAYSDEYNDSSLEDGEVCTECVGCTGCEDDTMDAATEEAADYANEATEEVSDETTEDNNSSNVEEAVIEPVEENTNVQEDTVAPDEFVAAINDAVEEVNVPTETPTNVFVAPDPTYTAPDPTYSAPDTTSYSSSSSDSGGSSDCGSSSDD